MSPPRWGYDKLRDCAYPATSRHRVTHAHTAPLARQQPLRLRPSPNAFRPLGCSRFTVSLIDSLKCRTVTATPAEPGDLPCWFRIKREVPLGHALIVTEAHSFRAERKEERATHGRLLWRERATGRLSRTVQLPRAVDADAVKATYVNGTLQLTMRKLVATKTKKISVA